MLQQFKKFAMRGNVLDLAVAVVMGGAFGKIVSSLVNDIIMPLMGLISGGINFSRLAWVIRPATEGREALAIRYGMFLQAVVDFLLIAFSIFVFIQIIDRFRKEEKKEEKPEQKPKEPPREVQLLEEIRDLLKQSE